MKSVSIAFVLATVVCAVYYNQVAADGATQIKSFNDLLEVAQQLESAAMQLKDLSQEIQKTRVELLYSFAREVKSIHCSRQQEAIIRTANEFKIKALNFVEETKGAGNWFTKNVFKFAGPLNQMKGLAKFDTFLLSVAERYELQAKNGGLKGVEIECDLIKFKAKNFYNLLFVIQTDIKYLIIENQQIQNRAIYDQLRADKFVTGTNFHEITELTNGQKEILLKFYTQRVNLVETTIEEGLEHFDEPGELIIGRLFEACQAIHQLEVEWRNLDSNYDAVCKPVSTDTTSRFFTQQYRFDKFNDTFFFCSALLDSL